MNCDDGVRPSLALATRKNNTCFALLAYAVGFAYTCMNSGRDEPTGAGVLSEVLFLTFGSVSRAVLPGEALLAK